MKRSEALAPLSRDHHRALVVARGLIRATDDDAVAATDRFVEFLHKHELGHFQLEEAVLVPVVPTGEPGSELTRRMLEDHEFLRSSLRRLSAPSRSRSQSQSQSTGLETDALHQIGARLRAHVQMEEQELFPYLEESLSEAQLAQVGASIRAAHAS